MVERLRAIGLKTHPGITAGVFLEEMDFLGLELLACWIEKRRKKRIPKKRIPKK